MPTRRERGRRQALLKLGTSLALASASCSCGISSTRHSPPGFIAIGSPLCRFGGRFQTFAQKSTINSSACRRGGLLSAGIAGRDMVQMGSGASAGMGKVMARVLQDRSDRAGLRSKKRAASVGALRATSMLLHDQPTFFGGRQPFTSQAARWFIQRSIETRCKASAGVRVQVEAQSNRQAMRGRFDTVSVEFQELVFEEIQVTGGAKIELLGVDVPTPGLLPGPMRRLRRLRRPCEVTGTSEFTDTDLAFSPAIRRLAQRIADHALRPRKKRTTRTGSGGRALASSGRSSSSRGSSGPVRDLQPRQRVHILRVRLNRNKLAVEGEMTNGGPFFGVPFRYEFSVSASRDGRVVHFRDPTIYMGTAGGHVPLPMLPLQSFDIDLGDRARIESLRISRGRLRVGGRFILSPVAPLTVSRGSKRGNIQHDLAETLSNTIFDLLRFKRE